jgi:ribonuclease VapC
MVIDSSALIALLLGEAETSRIVAAVAAAPRTRVSAASYLETAIVMIRRSGPQAREALDRLIADLDIEIVPFDQAQAMIASDAYVRFGKGGGHPAQMNYGDCFTYALAKVSGEPVLYKGDDFAHTDLVAALLP